MMTREDIEDRRVAKEKLWFTKVAKRIEVRTTAILKRHDALFRHRNPRIWQTHFSLEEHGLRVSMACSLIGLARMESLENVVRRGLQGLLHDVGKTRPECFKYRLMRDLSKTEVIEVARHQSFGGQEVLESFSIARTQDLNFFAPIFPPVCFHHTPHWIEEKRRRIEATDLRLADAVKSCTEDRHRPGVSLEEALDDVGEWVNSGRCAGAPARRRPHLQSEYEESFEIVRSVFLNNPSIIA